MQIFTDDLDGVLRSGNMLGLGTSITVTCPGPPRKRSFMCSITQMDQDINGAENFRQR